MVFSPVNHLVTYWSHSSTDFKLGTEGSGSVLPGSGSPAELLRDIQEERSAVLRRGLERKMQIVEGRKGKVLLGYPSERDNYWRLKKSGEKKYGMSLLSTQDSSAVHGRQKLKAQWDDLKKRYKEART